MTEVDLLGTTSGGITRRRMVGYLIAAPTLMAARAVGGPGPRPRSRRSSRPTRSTSATC